MFNLGLGQQTSSLQGSGSKASEARGKTGTALMAIKASSDEFMGEEGFLLGGVEASRGGDTDAALEGGDKKSPNGWEYWSFRVLLLGVAAIWGTNFPVVSAMGLSAARS